MAKAATPPGPTLSDADLIKVIQASGYPLEMVLYDHFEKAGMAPTIGMITRTREPGGDAASTHEIDLMVRIGLHGLTAGLASHAGLLAWIDAKQLHEPARFIGILGVQPSQHESRVNRSFYTGCPSFRVTDNRNEPSHLFIGPGGLSEALDPLNAAPLCVHWGIARPDGAGAWKVGGDGNQTPQGFKEERYHQSMSKLVAAVVWHERDTSEFFNGLPLNAAPMPSVTINTPTLIIDTPTLVVYDAKQKDVTHVDWFMLRWGAEINGIVHYRIIDVVTTNGVPAMIDRYKKAQEGLATHFHMHTLALGEAGRKLRKRSSP